MKQSETAESFLGSKRLLVFAAGIIVGLPVIVISSVSSSALGMESSACSNLADTKIENVRLDTIEMVAPSEAIPAYCRLVGEISPSIGFEMRLPIQAWNQRFLVSGCGAYCGEVEPDRRGYSNSINYALKRGYAALTTDSGHQAGRTQTSWAYNNAEAEQLYAHAWVPLATAASRELLKAFYGKPERYSYFSGCSNGGRTALKVAQLYPELFDGIASGCPTVSLTDAAGIQGVFLDRTLVDARGELILQAEKIPMLAQAVVYKCDQLDGLTDGIVSTPALCDFKPESLQCEDDSGSFGCLTAVEVDLVKRLYAGAIDSQGNALHYGMSHGSEPYWATSLVGATETGRHYLAEFGSNFLRYLGLEPDPGPGYHSNQFDLDRDIAKLENAGRLFNIIEPDLDKLRESGGKLLMYQGQADPVILYQQVEEFYEAVVIEAGSAEAVNEYFRFFLIPGADHCWATTGYAPDLFDPLQVLEEWVEAGQAPDRIIALQYAEIGAAEGAGPLLRSRPLCRYPQVARYTGHGSAYSAQNFVCVAPES